MLLEEVLLSHNLDFQWVVVLVDKAVSAPLGAAAESLKSPYLLALIGGGALRV